jgi:hypothetical protein
MVHIFKSDALRVVVADALSHFVKAPVDTLPPSERFSCGGVYALYYQGDFGLYSELSIDEIGENSRPIYIGKAVPSGWRTARISASQGQQLFNRIKEHYRNINSATNLNPDDFRCRYMVLDVDESGIIGPIEAALIRKFQPLWNTVIDGFGNHTPGAGRFEQAKSGWDVLHPGRAWAERCKGQAPSYDDLVVRINQYIKTVGKI